MQTLHDASASDSWGLLRAGAALLALRVEALQEVIACPPVLDVLPSSAHGLCGAVRLRGLVVPVLDLCTVLALEPGASGDRVIVLMRHGGRLLGLRADAVQGMVRVPTAELQALHVGAGADGLGIATHAFQAGGEVVTALDAAGIAALPQVPMVDQPIANTVAAGAVSSAEPLLLFHSAGVPLAIAATAVGATVPDVELRDSPLRRGHCLGVFEHQGHALAVVDLGALLGLTGKLEAGTPPRSALLVLRTAEGEVGLTMDRVSDIIRVAPEYILAAPALGLAMPSFYRGLVDTAAPRENAGGIERDATVLQARRSMPHFLLDAEALAADDLLTALASMRRRVETDAQTPASTGAAGADPRPSGRAVVTYQAGVEIASPLIQVSEIITPPASLVATSVPGSSTLGVFMHRGVAVPLVDLVELLFAGRGLQRAGAEAQRVLIVEDAGRRIGFMVDGLGTIETVRWECPARQQADAGFDAKQFATRPPLVELGPAGQTRTLAQLDLQAVTNSLCAA